MKCLLTGSQGAIGIVLSKELERRGYDVFGTARVLHEDSHQVFEGDLNDYSFVKSVFEAVDFDVVIHAAAAWNGINEDQGVFTNNLLSTANLLRAIPKSVKKFVFVSSSAVYSGEEFDDSGDVGLPGSAYGDSKIMSEQLVIQHASLIGMEFTIYRPFHVVSPFESYNPGSSHVCTDFCYKILESGEGVDISSLPVEKRMGFTSAYDFSECLAANLFNPAARNESFNLGTSLHYSLRDLAECVYHTGQLCGHLDLLERSTPDKWHPEVVPVKFKKLHKLAESNMETRLDKLVYKVISEKYGTENKAET